MRTRTQIDKLTNTGVVVPDIGAMKQGALTQKKIRRVCGQCNGGWMSRIVAAARPYAEAAILRDHFVVTKQIQEALAAWTMLSCVMAEYTDERFMAIPERDRLHLFDNKRPPDHWRLYIGLYEGVAWAPARYRHTGGQLLVIPPAPFDVLPPQEHWFQTTLFTLGAFAVYGFSSTYEKLAHDFERDGFAPIGMERIWPQREDFGWPTQRLLTDEEMQQITYRYEVARISA